MPEWLNTHQASEMSGYSRSYLGELVNEGKLIGRRDPPADERSKNGLHLWIDYESLMDYIDERGRSVPPSPPDTSQEGDVLCPWCQRGVADGPQLMRHIFIVHPRLMESYEPAKATVKRGRLCSTLPRLGNLRRIKTELE